MHMLTRLPLRLDCRAEMSAFTESLGVRKATPSVTMLLFWSAKLIQAKRNLAWSH